MNVQFDSISGLIPAVIQDALSRQVLMLGYMNQEALDCTLNTGKVTFYSRSKQRLWIKGESSGNYLYLQSLSCDCDQDSLLIQARAAGPTCHTGQYSCFAPKEAKGFLWYLEQIIASKIENRQTDSYTYELYQKGINKIAQKVGEEAVELVIEAKDNNRDLFCNEAADLLYHFLILLKTKGLSLADIETVLQDRHRP